MSKAEFYNRLIKLDVKLAAKALGNEKLNAKLKVQQLLKELNIPTTNKSL